MSSSSSSSSQKVEILLITVYPTPGRIILIDILSKKKISSVLFPGSVRTLPLLRYLPISVLLLFNLVQEGPEHLYYVRLFVLLSVTPAVSGADGQQQKIDLTYSVCLQYI